MLGSLKTTMLIAAAIVGGTVAAQAFMSTTQLDNVQFAAPRFATLNACLKAAGMPADLEQRYFDAVNYYCPGDPNQMSALQSTWDTTEAAGGECPPVAELGLTYDKAKSEIEKLIIGARCN